MQIVFTYPPEQRKGEMCGRGRGCWRALALEPRRAGYVATEALASGLGPIEGFVKAKTLVRLSGDVFW